MELLSVVPAFVAAIAGLIAAMVAVGGQERRTLNRVDRMLSIAERLPIGETRDALKARAEEETKRLLRAPAARVERIDALTEPKARVVLPLSGACWVVVALLLWLPNNDAWFWARVVLVPIGLLLGLWAGFVSGRFATRQMLRRSGA